MKKILILVSALFVAVSLSSCSKDDDKDVAIVGNWQLVSQTSYDSNQGWKEWEITKDTFLNLDADGNGTTNFDGDGRIKYKFINGKLFLTYIDHGNDEADWSVAKLTPSELILEWQRKEGFNEEKMILTFVRN